MPAPMLFSSCHQAEKVQCVVRLGLFAFIHLRVKARASCRKKLASGLGRVYPVYLYITTAKEHCNQPACHTTTRPKEPCNQPAQHGIGDLWRSATQDSTPCIPAQWACHGNVPQRPAQSSLSLLAPRTCGPINPRKTLGFPNNNGHRKFLLVSNTTLQRPYLHVGTHIFPAQAA